MVKFRAALLVLASFRPHLFVAFTTSSLFPFPVELQLARTTDGAQEMDEIEARLRQLCQCGGVRNGRYRHCLVRQVTQTLLIIVSALRERDTTRGIHIHVPGL